MIVMNNDRSDWLRESWT